jgi:mRNA interferase MazF
MVIRQGEVYWARLGVPSGSAPGYRRPVIVLQNDLFNRSRIHTVVVCAVTSNLRLAESPGNVRLRKGEADLPKESVANVTQIATIDRADLAERLGALSPGRLGEVLAGVRLVVQPIDL